MEAPARKGRDRLTYGPRRRGEVAGVVEREKVAHLREEVRVGERVGGELVAEEALRDLFDVGDGVQGHGGNLLCEDGSRIVREVRVRGNWQPIFQESAAPRAKG